MDLHGPICPLCVAPGTSCHSNRPALLWLTAIAPRLGATVTDITQTGPNQLSFTRQSGIGFTAIELNLLADWLESPQIPDRPAYFSGSAAAQ